MNEILCFALKVDATFWTTGRSADNKLSALGTLYQVRIVIWIIAMMVKVKDVFAHWSSTHCLTLAITWLARVTL